MPTALKVAQIEHIARRITDRIRDDTSSRCDLVAGWERERRPRMVDEDQSSVMLVPVPRRGVTPLEIEMLGVTVP